jgi:phage gp45-like
MADELSALRRLLRPLHNRIASGIARAFVHLVDNSPRLQALQLEILKGEIRDPVEHFQPYGFEAVPLAGSEALVVFVSNSRDHPIAVAVSDRRYRPLDGAPGMVGIYDDQGQTVRIYRDRIELESSTKIVLNAPLVETTGDLVVAGDVSDSVGTLAALRVAYDAHTHVSASPGAPTSTTSHPS